LRFWLLNILFVVLLSVSVRAQQNQYRVTGIEVNGNDVTKNEIITRELTFKVGDTLSLERMSYNIERSENNIFNTTLFNYVTIIPEFKENTVAFSIFVFERWYVWPFPLIENADRNFNVWWQNKDFDRLSYGMRLVWNNFRGRNETLVLTGKAGFQERLSLAYGIPYLDREKKFGLKLEVGYSMNKEVNYGSSENKRLFYKEIETPQRRNSYANMRFTWRDKLYTRQHFTLFYNRISVTDTLQELGQPFELLPGNSSKSIKIRVFQFQLRHQI
jgi:outer membrane protein assembly factor BamA